MTGWLIVGGCALGYFAIEMTQSVYFPDAPPSFLRKLWGRSRRQESRMGGSDNWAALLHFEVLRGPAASEHPPSVPGRDNHRSESLLRKRLLETQDLPSRALTLLVLADIAAREARRRDCWDLIQEAEESLRKGWQPLENRFYSVVACALRIKCVWQLQEGRIEDAFAALREAESLFGRSNWADLLRAKAHLLAHHPASCRDELAHLLGKQVSAPERTAAMLLIAESFLREKDNTALSSTLKGIDLSAGLSEDARAAYAGLRIEWSLGEGDLEAAWRHLSILHDVWRKNPGRLAHAHAFHLCCARLHLAEGNPGEAHRRLQLAENCALFPAALWEVQWLLGALLESEDREAEAKEIWRGLAEQAQETYFGLLAQARLSRHQPRPRSTQPLELAAILR
jgi:hypothetical protein